MKDLKDIGKKLVFLRNDKTQEEVAKSIGITCQALSNYENGIRSPRDEIKKRIADYYKKTVQEIFFD